MKTLSESMWENRWKDSPLNIWNNQKIPGFFNFFSQVSRSASTWVIQLFTIRRIWLVIFLHCHKSTPSLSLAYVTRDHIQSWSFTMCFFSSLPEEL